jgi:hypothetical protein
VTTPAPPPIRRDRRAAGLHPVDDELLPPLEPVIKVVSGDHVGQRQASPPQPHGPYCQLTRKIAGKTTTRRLTSDTDYATFSGEARRLCCSDRPVLRALSAM